MAENNNITTTGLTTTYERQGLAPEAIALAYKNGRCAGSYAAMLYLYEDGRIALDPEGFELWYSSGTPLDEYHRRTLTWRIPPTIDADALDAALAAETSELRQALETVHQGHSIEWDGNNNVGVLTGEADEAEDRVAELLDSSAEEWLGEAWNACDWIAAAGYTGTEILRAQLDLPPHSSADQIESAIIELARMEDVVIYDAAGAARQILREVEDEWLDAEFEGARGSHTIYLLGSMGRRRLHGENYILFDLNDPRAYCASNTIFPAPALLGAE